MTPGDVFGTETPDFSAVDDALKSAGAAFRAADAHGLLCGLACTCRDVSEAEWVREVFGPTQGVEPPAPQCHGLLSTLYEQTMGQLTSTECVFSVFSPADEQPLRDRAGALKSWCQGFLYGLAVGRARLGVSLVPQAREVVADFSEISKLDELVADHEANEVAYSELIEYVKVAVMLLREELGGSPRAAASDATLGGH